jgi:predicted kinase
MTLKLLSALLLLVFYWNLNNIYQHGIIIIVIKLNRSKCGYQENGTERKINHLLYMDDLKLKGRSEEELRNEIKIVKTFSDYIKMEFGLEKCARISLKNGTVYRKQHTGNSMEY